MAYLEQKCTGSWHDSPGAVDPDFVTNVNNQVYWDRKSRNMLLSSDYVPLMTSPLKSP